MIYNIEEELDKYEFAKNDLSKVPVDKWERTEVLTDLNNKPYTVGIKNGVSWKLEPNEEENQVVASNTPSITDIEKEKQVALKADLNLVKPDPNAPLPRIIGDTVKATTRAAATVGENTTSLVANVLGAPGDLGNYLARLAGNEDYEGIVPGSEAINDTFQNALGWIDTNLMGNNPIDTWAAEPYNNETFGNLTEGLAQFIIPAVPAAKLVKAGDMIVNGMVSLSPMVRGYMWGAIADTLAFPANEELITKNLAEYFVGKTPEERTEFANQVMGIFEKNPENAEIFNTLKTTSEGLIIGGIVDGTLRSIPFLRTAIRAAKGINWKELYDRVEIDPNTLSSGGFGGISLKNKPQEINSIDIMNANESPVVGSGKNNKVTIKDITEYLNQEPKLDITKPENVNKIVIKSVDEINYQLNQEKTGLGWYDKDVKEAMDLLDEINPKFKGNGDAKGLMPFLTAIASAGTPVGQDFKVATQIADIFLDTGKLPLINPKTGKGWTRRSHIPGQLEFVQNYIDNNGLSLFLEFLHAPTTRKEVNALRKQYNMKPVAGALYSDIVGADIFGPKVSKFMANLMGVADENVPDIWFTRGFNRKAGDMYVTTKEGVQSNAEQPRNLTERQIMDDVISKISQEIKLNNRDTQAVLWYFEQGLYTKLGVKSEPKSYADVTRQILEGKTNVTDGSVP